MSNPVSPRTPSLTGQVLSGPFGARLLDFTGDTTPWQRRLWSLGTAQALRELYEAGPWVDAQVLSPAALQWHCRDLERLAGDDAGLGAPEVRRQLREVLRADLSEHSRHRRRLRELIALIDESYIPRWTAAVDASQAVSSERLARAVAAHLLDCVRAVRSEAVVSRSGDQSCAVEYHRKRDEQRSRQAAPSSQKARDGNPEF